MTPIFKPRPRTLLQLSRCAAPLRGQLPQSTGPRFGASYEKELPGFRNHPNSQETLPSSSPQHATLRTAKDHSGNTLQKPKINSLEFDNTFAFGCKFSGKGLHLKPTREPVQATRPPQFMMFGSWQISVGTICQFYHNGLLKRALLFNL